MSSTNEQLLLPTDSFAHRHLGSNEADITRMLTAIDCPSLEALVEQTVPSSIMHVGQFNLERSVRSRPLGEQELLDAMRGVAGQNQLFKSFLGMGYYGCHVPPVILRNILENPGWYTQYTPYQAEISQGRLEALLNFQTMITDLTGMALANASLLDEATAAAEAMNMCYNITRNKKHTFFISQHCHPQTIAVIETRASALGITIEVGDEFSAAALGADVFGVLVQYPATDGRIYDYSALVEQVHKAGALIVTATDLLALTLLRAPGDFGVDIAIGSAQRFGVPMGYGGPHAAFLATRDEHKRQISGRVIGVSKDARGKAAYRMAMQTREQHIRREKATSNICTAQALLAIMASMYAVYHGPQGIKRIAQRVFGLAQVLAAGLRKLGYPLSDDAFFDTIRVPVGNGDAPLIVRTAAEHMINLRQFDADTIIIALDETCTPMDVDALLTLFSAHKKSNVRFDDIATKVSDVLPGVHQRKSEFLTHAVFNSYHSEHEMLRYINRLRNRDLSLTHSMIPLGSCTMKLNATSEMLPVTWPEFGNIHPFVPVSQAQGYQAIFSTLERWLCNITGFAAVSLQPNAGSQGEFAGLMVIRAYHQSRGDTQRTVCLIPVSAHGTNPASAAMAGMQVVPVACDAMGNIDLADLEAKAKTHQEKLAAVMVTYPSTHGVFEESIRDICRIVHQHGGQVYLDGANMNAQVGLCRPGDYGADVCHLNLHKTFCIPHGGGGPGMGPIGVAKHLEDFLPGHPLVKCGGRKAIGPVSAAPWGSASILPISWIYIALMGAQGLVQATQLAILNANYMAQRLKDHFPLLYSGRNGRVAHEFILDLRPFKESAGIEAEDVAKRLMDYGFHAPTMSFPVAGTLMIEPTESESKAELDRFCDAMIAIRQEIQAIESGHSDKQNNVLKNAPHTAEVVTSTEWSYSYSREQAAYPLAWVRDNKFWPHVSRIDNAWGDRNLICTCPPIESYV